MQQQLDFLRTLMTQQGINFYYVPSSDPHQNEYVPEIWQRRSFISNFTGSAGDVLIGLDQAYLFTDGRYFLQAEKELDPACYQLIKRIQGSGNSFFEFLTQEAKILKSKNLKLKLGLDPQTISAQEGEKLKELLNNLDGELVCLENNLIDEVKRADTQVRPYTDDPCRGGPACPPSPMVRLADLKTAGVSAQEKIKIIFNTMQSEQASYLIINTLDTIAWLLNIRGQDISFNPLVISYVILDFDLEKNLGKTRWFLDLNKLSPELKKYCESQNIVLYPYEDFAQALKNLNQNLNSHPDHKIWLDPQSVNYWIKEHFKNNLNNLILKKPPLELLKACKNPSEIQGMKTAHIKDAVSLIKFIYWLENNWKDKDEYEIGEQLLAFRSQDKDFQGPSFETIAGYDSNSAVIHYRADKNSAKKLSDQNLFLLDSGGQYPQGTTDITRVFHFGTPTQDHKKHYTLVLKGHLALARAVFAHGTTGMHLDSLARQFLWSEGLDFLHGTGHGVGCNLCVHEGPQRISAGFNTQALLPGMVVSNEPGVYFSGKYGIRIENLCFVKEVLPKDSYNIGVGPFLGFEDLTLVPYALNLIDFDLLNAQELEQIKNYHQRILSTVGDLLPGEVKTWLEEKTKL